MYPLGVLKHTPDVESAFFSLPPMLTSGGQLCVDYYERSYRSWLLPKYWLRPITKRMRRERVFSLVESMVPVLLPLSNVVGAIPGVGQKLKRMVPVANYRGEQPLSDIQIREWAVLDTFD